MLIVGVPWTPLASQVPSSIQMAPQCLCSICDGTIIGPVFLEGILTTARCVNEVLQGPVEEICTTVLLWLAVVPAQWCPRAQLLPSLCLSWHTFPNHWVGRFGPMPWPTRSPYLMLLDFLMGLCEGPHVHWGDSSTLCPQGEGHSNLPWNSKGHDV